MSSIKYQPHIDGLRAIAVLSVVIFHLEGSYLPGGFLGVDIFFVISGYLITSIIYKNKLNGNFSFSDFYVRRAKRILPPLFFVLFLTLIAGYILMLPYDFYKLGISSLSVITFLANIQYSLRTGDYFSGDSAEWPLLHTWSLSVEEQYYFVFPILLFTLIVKFPRALDIVLLSLLVASFCLAEFISRSTGYETFSYYLLFTRMGELLVGSMLAILQSKKVLNHINSSLTSFFLICALLALMIIVNERTVFPGFVAFIACLITAGLINSNNKITSILLANKLSIFVGIISYSLYLFHWPVLAFFRYIYSVSDENQNLSISLQVFSVMIIIPLSLFSYYCIESPLRKVQSSKVKVGLFYFLLPTLIISFISGAIILNKGIPQRLDTNNIQASYQFSHIDNENCTSYIILGCSAGDINSDKKILIYGNSHGEHYFRYINELAKAYSYRTELYSKGGCSLLSKTLACLRVRTEFERALEKSNAEVVVIAFRWDTTVKKEGALSELALSLNTIKTKAERVIILAQPPLLLLNPAKVANCERLSLDCKESIRFSDDYPVYNIKVRNAISSTGVEFFDPFDYVNNRFKYKDDSRYYYYDLDHMNVYGNLWLAESYLKKESDSIF